MLRLEDLQVPDLEPVSLTVAAGACIGLTGKSGSGKTRLLRAIADMDEHGGEVYAEDVAFALDQVADRGAGPLRLELLSGVGGLRCCRPRASGGSISSGSISMHTINTSRRWASGRTS